jgi:hypothetical protein
MPVLRLIPHVLIFVAAVCAPWVAAAVQASGAADPETAARHFRLVNATFDSVTAFAVAPVGSTAYIDVPLASPLQGGLNSTVVRVPAGACLRDVRVSFLNGRVQTYPMFDVCRHTGMRLTNGGGPSFRPGLLVAGD